MAHCCADIDIRTQFTLDAEEAERNNDAIAFVRALRRKDQAVSAAKIARSDSKKDAGTDRKQRLADLKESQRIERDQLAQNEAERLAALQLSLERRLEEERLSNEKRIIEQQDTDERALLQQQTALERQIEAQNRGATRKLDALKLALDAEVAAVVQAEEDKITAIINANARVDALRLDAIQKQADILAAKDPRFTPIPREHGGRVAAGLPYLVGEKRPEVFVPDQSGVIVPNVQAMPHIAASNAAAAQTSIDNRRTIEQVSVGQSVFDDPIQLLKFKNLIQQVILETG